MESNKEDAIKCLSIARKSIELANLEKAQRFVEKSIRLYPTPEAEQLLTNLKNGRYATASSRSAAASSTKNHKASTSTLGSTDTSSDQRNYTAEQVKAVKEVLAYSKDYYKVLSVEKTATDAQLKKAYRKKALLFHPDKNSAPGADEAFKLVAKAYDILSDPQKRAIHDEGGDLDNSSRGRSSSYQQYHAYNSSYGQDISPEDLFNMFFGGGVRTSNFGPGAGYRYQQQQFRQRHPFYNNRQQRRQQQYNNHQHQQESTFSIGMLSQFLPIILLFLLAIFSLIFSFESEPLYTFRPQGSNVQLRSTQANNIKYYVNPKSFAQYVNQNAWKFQRTERQIESAWVDELRLACQQEQRQRANLMAQADGIIFGVGRNEKAYRQAEKMQLKHCEELRRLAPKIRG
ncbi:hypothetical protein BDF20DRAFT_910639 [Mycotypha africana]|uniref:uncharacterized protein n=1 Tax=Mycotypha africana TaxID=64632 RepID=UPI0023011535|nr:uncharacterized protein BDF20DRAFT_910639 [Mycotypha africana]KAI8988100.1 hypothetical protein BDF20DRAFT_910639 [Mycotypha africana]